MKKIPRSKKAKKLPVVLSKQEVKMLFHATPNLKHKAILITIYSAGLRLGEVARLKVTDIDSKQTLKKTQHLIENLGRYTHCIV